MLKYESPHGKTNEVTCEPCEELDQRAHLHIQVCITPMQQPA